MQLTKECYSANTRLLEADQLWQIARLGWAKARAAATKSTAGAGVRSTGTGAESTELVGPGNGPATRSSRNADCCSSAGDGSHDWKERAISLVESTASFRVGNVWPGATSTTCRSCDSCPDFLSSSTCCRFGFASFLWLGSCCSLRADSRGGGSRLT